MKKTLSAVLVLLAFAACSQRATVPVESITLSGHSAQILQGRTYQLTADIAPAAASASSLKWESSDEGIAEVDGNGLVTGISEGFAKIYCFAPSTDGKMVSDTCAIEVAALIPTIDLITINPASYTLKVYTKIQLLVEIEPASVSPDYIVWKSSNPSVAKVSDTGLVSALSKGTTVITASSPDGTVSGKCNITVN